MHKLVVGQPYSGDRNSWSEAVEYNFAGGVHELRLFFLGPAPQEIEAVRKAPVNFGLFVQGDIISLMYRFIDYKNRRIVLEGDCPFSIHMVPESYRSLPEMPTEEHTRVLLNIALINAENGIVLALRAVSLSPAFSRALCSAIIEQSKYPFVSEEYDAKLVNLYMAYPSVSDMFQHCVETCVGGE